MRLIFLHIPRTGGMSIRSIFDNNLGATNVGKPWWGRHQGESISFEETTKKAWYGHFKFGLHEQLPKDAKYITVLREPTERFLSEYFRNDYRHRLGYTPLKLIKNLGRCYGYDNMGDNLQVRMLSGAGPRVVLDDSHVDQAIANLYSHFVHVGYTDLRSMTLSWLQQYMDWDVPNVHINHGKNPWSHSPREHRELRKCKQLALDYKLWRYLRAC